MQHDPSGGEPAVAQRRGARRPALAVALAAALLLPVLGSCAWLMEEESPPPVACPAAVPLEGAHRKTDFAPGGARDAGSIRWVAAINQISTRCERADGGRELELRFAVVAEAGPAFDGAPVVLDLLVAAVGPDQRIQGRRRLGVRLDLGGASGRAGQIETLTFELPGDRSGRGAARFYVGFQLDRAEMQERLQRLRR